MLPDGRDGPLRMRDPMSVDRRCDARYRSLLDKPVRATALLVTVTGQGGKPVLWRWQRTFSPAGTPDGRFLAEHTVRVRPRVAFPKVIGEALLVCGAVFAAVPLFMGGESAIGGDFMVMGAGMGGAGLLTAIAAPRAMLSYPSPDPLMCQKRDAHWLNAQAPAPVDARAARIFASRAVSHLWGAKQ